VSFAVEYADQAQRDHRAFVKAVRQGSHQGCHLRSKHDAGLGAAK